MYKLVKFTNHAESFQNGCLYMNTMDYFWNNGFDEQKDILEGVIYSVSPKNTTGFDEEFLNVQASDFKIQAAGYAYCNIFCMSIIELLMLNNGNLIHTFSQEMQKFGEKAVIIDNESEYLRRINKAAKDMKYLCGRVNYHKPYLEGNESHPKHTVELKTTEKFDFSSIISNGRKYDAFDKNYKYRAQNEWRLCLYRGERTTDAYPFNIGDLHDITHVVDTKDFLKHFLKEAQKHTLEKGNICYYGNTNRSDLRNMFYELEDNKAWMISTIG